jgi:hypothetical protein
VAEAVAATAVAKIAAIAASNSRVSPARLSTLTARLAPCRRRPSVLRGSRTELPQQRHPRAPGIRVRS